jgi:hypothetical protein
MKKFLWFVATAFAFGLFLPIPSASLDQTQIERGKYLAEQVAMCVQCHSPRDAEGELDRHTLFKGARIPIASPFPNKQWALSAPRIAGLPGWEEEDFITLLMTGSRPTGEVPRPPMPPFRMSREDASAIAAFLISLR